MTSPAFQARFAQLLAAGALISEAHAQALQELERGPLPAAAQPHPSRPDEATVRRLEHQHRRDLASRRARRHAQPERP